MDKTKFTKKQGKKQTEKQKNALQKIWHFLWKSNSIWSWIIDLILIFVIVKYAVFPFFSLVLSTSLPFVIIESESMDHRIIEDSRGTLRLCGEVYEETQEIDDDAYWEACGSWYEENNISRQVFMEWKYNSGLNEGDIVVVKGQDSYKVGDVIIFKMPEKPVPIIHRVVAMKGENVVLFTTKGDHNGNSDDTRVQQEQIYGKAIFRIPKIGWLKLALFRLPLLLSV